MIRTTSEGAFVWFQLEVRRDHKIEWPLELFLAYSKTSKDESELRCQLWDTGTVSPLTDRERLELEAAKPFDKSKIAWERTAWEARQTALLNGKRDGALPIPETAKAAVA